MVICDICGNTSDNYYAGCNNGNNRNSFRFPSLFYFDIIFCSQKVFRNVFRRAEVVGNRLLVQIFAAVVDELFNVCTQTLQELLFPLGGAGHFLFHLVQVLGNRQG